MAAELVQNGTTLKTLAGLTDVQLVQIYFRQRDQYGRLIREKNEENIGPDHPDWHSTPCVKKAVSFKEMYFSLYRGRNDRLKGQIINGRVFPGFTEEDIQARWDNYLKKNPGLASKEG
jgi:hypothetical protein